MSNPTELLNCPFCGSRQASICERDHLHFVMCDNCTAEGPAIDGAQSRLDAAKEWNRRAQPEGEAPQAEKWRHAANEWADTAYNGLQHLRNIEDGISEAKYARENMEKCCQHASAVAEAAATLSPLCGAQHAESGKEAASAERVLLAEVLAAHDQRTRVETAAMGFGLATNPLMERVRAALAAQQAAAPGALEKSARALAEKWHKDAVDTGFATSEAAVELLEVLDAAPSAPGTPEAPQTAAARDVLAERQRQVEQEGWTPAHDDQYDSDELSLAAACYALAGDGGKHFAAPDYWPWDPDWWKPTTDRQNLVKAGALVLAEIERLDRAAQLDGGQEGSDHA